MSAFTVSPATIAFDRLAPDYDALATGEIFTLLRRRTHTAFARAFTPGQRVLEIGCGTGIDTAFLAGRGVRVIACDPSEAMVSRALRRLASSGVEQRATVLPCGLQELDAFLAAIDGDRGGFDGIISNFGALNCVACLEPLKAIAQTHLRPGGVVMLCLIGRSCAAEMLYFTVTGRRELAARRRCDGPVPVPVAGIDVPTFYHTPSYVTQALSPTLSLRRVDGIGVTIPPPYLEARWSTLPGFVRQIAAGVDRVVSPWPPFNRLGDHVLMRFEKPQVGRG